VKGGVQAAPCSNEAPVASCPNSLGGDRRRTPSRVPNGLLVAYPATVYALGLALIASVYIGFAVADGRRTILAVESIVAVCVPRGDWDLRTGLVPGGRPRGPWPQGFLAGAASVCLRDALVWWPPFCAAVDWVAASLIAIEIVWGVRFHQ
jgi:hypothetical protein